ncbi:hypothetical protein N5K55_04850 (plasmid) [Pseudomonas aeruginosa]|nr:hypothetical protein [Pseudomonas aeruginosa]
MHFIEAEKFRGLDEGYRRYILSIEDRDDFILETAGITQGVRRPDWDEIKAPMVRAGLWMQLVQHKDSMVPLVTHPGCECPVGLVNEAIQEIYERLHSGDPLRKVLLAGDDSPDALRNSSFDEVLDHIFNVRQPDEVIVSADGGVSMRSAAYAARRYIPLRFLPRAQSAAEFAENAISQATHVFLLGPPWPSFLCSSSIRFSMRNRSCCPPGRAASVKARNLGVILFPHTHGRVRG